MGSTIMIVDDMKLNIELLAEHLGKQYTIMPATSGEAAIRLLARKKPDLVLLDVFMPGIDGFGVLKYMKEQEELSHIPVIFITGEQDAYSEEKGLSLGAVDYVKKPFNMVVVTTKIQNHLTWKMYNDNLEELVLKRTNLLEQRTLLLEKRTKQLDASRESIIMGMSLMSDHHDKVTGDHIERIKGFTNVLSYKMLEMFPDVITPEVAHQTTLFSPMHDIGKVGISDRILNKPGPLTPEEFNIIKTHTLEGAALLRQTTKFLSEDGDGNDLQVAIEIAECHHEQYGGTGYPHGLVGDAIPLPARIVAVADVYDALRSERPYKNSFAHQEALDIMLIGDRKSRNKHFDPRILLVLEAVEDEFSKIYQ